MMNEPKLAHRNILLLFWLLTRVRISHSAEHFTFKLRVLPPQKKYWEGTQKQ